MAYHPLLDWRLARDMLCILDVGEIDLASHLRDALRLAGTFAKTFGGQLTNLANDMPAILFDDRALLIAHPLEEKAQEYMSMRLAQATNAAEELGFGDALARPIVITDTFSLLRRPGLVYGELYLA